MGEVWLTHPQLTPAHDFKCLRSALGTWVASGWQERADQSDPVDEFVPADPRPPVGDDVPEAPALSGTSKTPSPAPRKES